MHARIALCLALLAGGCSALTVRRAMSNQPAEPPRCTGSVVAPVLDTLAATAAAGATGAAIFHCWGRDAGCSVAPFASVGVLVTAVMTSSAVEGFDQTHRCRCLKKQHEAYVDLHPESGGL